MLTVAATLRQAQCMCLSDDAADGRELSEEQRREARRLAAHTGADMRTVKRWALGQSVTDLVDYGLRAACRELAISTLPLGSEPSDADDDASAQGAA